jgi:hypothetical protein
MSEAHSSGACTAKEGEDEAFVEAWTELTAKETSVVSRPLRSGRSVGGGRTQGAWSRKCRK